MDPREQRVQAASAVTPERQAEIDRLAAHIKGRRAKWARRSPAVTNRQQLEDFARAEAANEREKDRRL